MSDEWQEHVIRRRNPLVIEVISLRRRRVGWRGQPNVLERESLEPSYGQDLPHTNATHILGTSLSPLISRGCVAEESTKQKGVNRFRNSPSIVLIDHLAPTHEDQITLNNIFYSRTRPPANTLLLVCRLFKFKVIYHLLSTSPRKGAKLAEAEHHNNIEAMRFLPIKSISRFDIGPMMRCGHMYMFLNVCCSVC